MAGGMAAAASIPLLGGFAASPAGATTRKAANPNERYVMLAYITANSFWIDLKVGGSDAAKALGVKFEFTGPTTYDVDSQIATAIQEIATKPAGLIFPVSLADACTPVINQATKAGIPVITVDSDAPDSQRLCFIGTDHYELGQTVGDQLIEVTGGTANVGVSTVPGQADLELRLAGLKNVFASHPGMKIIAEVNNNGDTGQTATTAVAMIDAHSNMNAIACLNATTSGIATALQETHKVGKIKVVGSDVTAPVLSAVENGTIYSIMAQRTYMEAYLAVQLLYLNNHPTAFLGIEKKAGIPILPVNIDTGTIIVNKQNAHAYTDIVKVYGG
jgi:ribose transport system substrate-binding protein